MGLGATLRLAQLAAGRSMFIDEAAIALNLRAHGFGALAGPLDYAQTAPVGFLWAEKAVAVVAGDGEIALRLLPFVASIGALALLAMLARRLLPPAGAFVAVALVALSPLHAYFAANAKPYACDTLAGMLGILAGLASLRGARRGPAAAALLPWISQPAALVLAGVGAVAALRRRGVWPIVGLWAFSCMAAAFQARHALSPAVDAFMHRFWASGFPSAPGGPLAWLATVGTLAFAYLFWLAVPLSIAAAGLAVAGAVSLARRRPDAAALVLAPIAVGLACAAAGALPFGGYEARYDGRLLFYLAPSFALLVGAGVSALPWRVPRLTVAALLLLGLAPAALHFPVHRDEVRPVLAAMGAVRHGEPLYVSRRAELPFRYYARGDTSGVLWGGCGVDRPALLYRDLDRLPRGPAWVLTVQARPVERTAFDAYVRANATVTYETSGLGARASRIVLGGARRWPSVPPAPVGPRDVCDELQTAAASTQ